jgi:DNA (cytosine-5)-methyltransferase 1
MKKWNYYNDFDPKACEWARELIRRKLIPDGEVDCRSITDVRPHDLKGFVQCHFFCGILGWSLALRLAGVPEDRNLWTASLPCQPFSTAGKQLGTDDERHLAPVFLELVRQCNPATLLGEQVASKIARTQWLPGIRLELEALGYSFGAVDLCSPCAGEIGEGRIVRGDSESWERVILGQPHIRQRLYWVAHRMADTDSLGELRDSRSGDEGTGPCGELLGRGLLEADSDGTHSAEWVAHAERDGREMEILASGSCGSSDGVGASDESGSDGLYGGKRVSFAADCLGGDDEEFGDECPICGLTYAEDCECPGPTHDGYEYAERDGVLYARRMGDTWSAEPQGHARDVSDRSEPGRVNQEPTGSTGSAGGSGIVLLPCRDGKTRRTESGIFPLVAGIPRGVVPSGDPSDPSYANATAEARAVRLKGYGNAIQIDTAVLFIQTAFEAIHNPTP